MKSIMLDSRICSAFLSCSSAYSLAKSLYQDSLVNSSPETTGALETLYYLLLQMKRISEELEELNHLELKHAPLDKVFTANRKLAQLDDEFAVFAEAQPPIRDHQHHQMFLHGLFGISQLLFSAKKEFDGIFLEPSEQAA